jgi:hypothetical protein
LASLFPENPGLRAIIKVRIIRVSDSCGFAVPFFDYQEHRDSLDQWAAAKGTIKLKEYRQERNVTSIDGLPALDDA